jgi:hypothetical protein
MTYSHKVVNGKQVALTTQEIAGLEQRDLDWANRVEVKPTAAEKVERMLKAYDLTVGELKNELTKP